MNIIFLFRFNRMNFRSRNNSMKHIFILPRISRRTLCFNYFLYCQRTNSTSMQFSRLVRGLSNVAFNFRQRNANTQGTNNSMSSRIITINFIGNNLFHFLYSTTFISHINRRRSIIFRFLRGLYQRSSVKQTIYPCINVRQFSFKAITTTNQDKSRIRRKIRRNRMFNIIRVVGHCILSFYMATRSVWSL